MKSHFKRKILVLFAVMTSIGFALSLLLVCCVILNPGATIIDGTHGEVIVMSREWGPIHYVIFSMPVFLFCSLVTILSLLHNCRIELNE